MGCCATNESNSELQFRGMEANYTEAIHKGNTLKGNRSTNPSDYSYTENGTSQISSQVQIKMQNLTKTHRRNSNDKYTDEQGVQLAQTWPTLQGQTAQNQRSVTTNKESQNKRSPKNVTFNQSSSSQNPVRIVNLAQNAQLRIRFGPLTTINEQESQLGDTVKLSDLGSRAQLNNPCRSNFQE